VGQIDLGSLEGLKMSDSDEVASFIERWIEDAFEKVFWRYDLNEEEIEQIISEHFGSDLAEWFANWAEDV